MISTEARRSKPAERSSPSPASKWRKTEGVVRPEAARTVPRQVIFAGRTEDTKRELLERIMEDVGGILGPSIAEYGRVLPNPGQEDAWFAQLPPELQEQLVKLA